MAISSPLSSLASTAKDTTKKTVSISRVLTRSIQTKKNLYASKKIFSRRRNENAKRAEIRDRFLAPILVTRDKGPRSLALTDTSTSVSDRLLGFIGYLSAGWILSNMPTWIRIGEQFSNRLIIAGRILSNYGDESVRVMEGISDVFGAALENISRFDFTDSSYLVRSSLNDLKDEIDALGVGLKQAFDVMLQPFTDIPPPGTYQPDEPTPPPPSGGDADFWLLSLISLYESLNPQGAADVAQSIYNRMGYSGRTSRQVILSSGQYEPVGKFGKTSDWNKVVDRDTAIAHIKKYPGNGASPSGLDKVATALTNTSMQQSAAKFVGNRPDFRSEGTEKKYDDMTNDATRYGQTFGFNRGSAYVGKSNLPAPVPPIAKQTPSQPPITGQGRLRKGDVFTKSLGKGVDFIEISDVVGSPRKGGRIHGGIDVAAPSGTYIALRVDAEWVAYAYQPGGYGHVLDLWIPSYGIQLRFAHLLEQPAKLSKIPAGTSFARVGSSGGTTGPHIHLEYDTQKGTRGGGAMNDDPNYAATLDQYVRLLLLTKNPNKGKFSPVTATASLVPSTPSVATNTEDQVEMETNSYLAGLLNGITQERKGRKILVIDDRSMGGVQQVISSAGGDDIQIQIPESALLNNFIKNKFLLDLTYV